MEQSIREILSTQCEKIIFEKKNGDLLVNLDCYALTGYAAADLFKLARENGRSCVITIQAINDPHLKIILHK